MSLEPDRDQIEIFVEAIFRRAASQGFVAVRSFFEDDDSKPARLSSADLRDGLRFLIDVAEDDARRAAQHPRPIVFCPPLAVFSNKDRARESDIAQGLALSVELDAHPLQARATLENILGPATVVIKSGGRWTNGAGDEDKLHIHWRLSRPAGGADLEKLKRARDLAARLVGGDPSNKPVCHPIRWPGSWHRKADPRLCQIDVLDADREIDLDTALSALTAAAPEAVKAPSGNGADHGDSGEWPELVAGIVTGESYHNPLVSLSSRLVGSGMHDGTTVKLLRALMMATGAEHDTRWQARYDKIPSIVASAREKFEPQSDGSGKPKPKSSGQDGDEEAVARELGDIAQRLVSATALAYDPEPTRDWLVDEIILADNLTLVSGAGGCGKTTLMLQLAVAMQIGGYWLNTPVKQGLALFVSSEDERKDLNMSLRAIVKPEGKSLAHCPDLHILSLADRDSCMAAAPSKLATLAATPLWLALEATVERLKPRALFLDALADLFGGEENFRRHARSFIVLLKRLAFVHKLAVVLIAHPSLSGINTGTGLSGSTDWHNGPRGRLYLSVPADNDTTIIDRSRRDLTVKKAQHSDAEGTVFHLRLTDKVFVCEGREGGSTPYDRAATAAKAETVFLTLLLAFEDQGRSVSPNPGVSYAPAVFAKEPSVNVAKEALARAMSNLLRDKRIHIAGVGPKSHQRKKLAAGPPPASGEDQQ